MNPIVLVIIFAVATLLGYKAINQVPSLLHTPLMSGMNALSGITILGAVTATALAINIGGFWGTVLGFLAIVLAMINVVGGFAVTHRMLKMFKSKR
mgnify:CR=1 FL=1